MAKKELLYTVEVDGKLPYTCSGRLVVSSQKAAAKAARRLKGKVVAVEFVPGEGDSGLCLACDASGFDEFWTAWKNPSEGAH